MSRFSQRYGYVAVRSVMQTGTIDEGLRNRLWNLICNKFFPAIPLHEAQNSNYLPHLDLVRPVFETLWHNFFKRATDTIGGSYIKALSQVKKFFTTCEWYEVYDMVEFLA